MISRNPLEWSIDFFGLRGEAAETAPGLRRAGAPTAVRRIGAGDLREALAQGFEDFAALRSDVVFLCLFYPVAGLAIARVAFGYDLLPLLFPLTSGFALVGPVAAIGLYELSRRRGRGEAPGWSQVLEVFAAPGIGAIVGLAAMLIGIFLLWLAAAATIYDLTLGPTPPASAQQFAADVLGTPAGWAMIGIGFAVGFVFAVVVLAVGTVSFPLLLDREVGLATAVRISVEAFRENAAPMLLWGAIVAAGLVVGSLPLLLGLVVVLPVLGHATWHLYRKLVQP